MPTGTVKRFNPVTGYGFIIPENSDRDVFVHITAVHAAGLKKLIEGQKIYYDLTTERGKVTATNLRLAEKTA